LSSVAAGRYDRDIVAFETPAGLFVTTDEGPRANTSLELLAKLKPVVRGGSIVTAGNSSSLNDGAAAVLIASAEAIERFGLTPRARVVGGASAALAPEVMGLGPVPATQKLLSRIGIRVDQIGAVELNEAFATQALACMRLIGLDEEIVNADGGAIALGHPLGASGARILVTLLGRMEREQAQFGLATMCVGVGQGSALLVESV
jgi:acetyl-CoA C-acetyltransferase